MKKIFYLMSALLLMTSCASMSRTGIVAPFAYTEVQPNEIRSEIDLSEQNKVTGDAQRWYVFGLKISGDNRFFEDRTQKPSIFGRRINKVQSCAMYNAMEKGNYDIIVNPQYRNSTHCYFFGLVKGYKVSINGYGGKIKKLYQHTEPASYQTIMR